MMASSNPAAAARYTPGSWLGVVRSGTVVLLRPDSAPALVDSLWELLAAGPEVHEVLDAVTSASGGSLARLPWFAIVASSGSIQVFLRGEIDLTVDLPCRAGGTERPRCHHLDGTALRSGRRIQPDGPRRRRRRASGARTGLLADLPLADGVVLLQGLRVDFTGAAGPVGRPCGPVPRPARPLRPASLRRMLTAVELAAGTAAADAEAAVEDEVLAAAEADIAAELSDHGASAETVLEFPGEDSEHDGTLHGEPEPEHGTIDPSRNRYPNRPNRS